MLKITNLIFFEDKFNQIIAFDYFSIKSPQMPPNKYMLSLQPETDPIQMLFLVQGKLTRSIKLYQLSGSIQIKDSSNLALIVGDFQEGLCRTAKIFFHGNQQVQNIIAQINRNGDVMVGGACAILQAGDSEYNGGFAGYKKQGYGELAFSGRNEYGVWKDDLRQGVFIEQEESEGLLSKTSKIIYHKSKPVQQMKLIAKGNVYYKIQEGDGTINVIDRNMYQSQLKDIGKWKIKLIANICDRLQKIGLNYRPQLGFSKTDVIYCKKLSYKMCEAYLNKLYHTQMCQQKGRTAVLSIELADLMDQQQNRSQDLTIEREKYIKKLIYRSMNQFSGAFKLLNGFWTHIIIPFALPNKYDHYSFARITVSKGSLRYVYYDSLKSLSRFPDMSKKYFQITKKLLLGQMLKDSSNQQMHAAIINMKLQIYDRFPQQLEGDYDYCGFYMLKGVQQLMKLDRICFQSVEIKQIRREILQKLREIATWSEVQQKQLDFREVEKSQLL